MPRRAAENPVVANQRFVVTQEDWRFGLSCNYCGHRIPFGCNAWWIGMEVECGLCHDNP